MSEVLIGVIIGGIIASISPVASLLIDHFRWKKEKKLEHLRLERKRLEDLFTKTLEQLSEAMKKNKYPSKMTSDILILMPKNVSEKFQSWMDKENPTTLEGKHAYMDIAVEMKKSLSEIDNEIKELVSK